METKAVDSDLSIDKVKAWGFTILLGLCGFWGAQMYNMGLKISEKLDRLTIMVERQEVKQEQNEKDQDQTKRELEQLRYELTAIQTKRNLEQQ